MVTNGSVTSVTEISNAVSGDAGPDSRGFPASSFPDVNGSSPEATAAAMAEMSGSAVAAELDALAGLSGEGGGAAGVDALAADSEAGDAVAGDGGAGQEEEDEEEDEPPPFLEEFEEVELQVRFLFFCM